MKRGPQKYSREIILSAIKKHEEGATLNSIASDIGIPKTTIKYWLDHPNKFLAEPGAENSSEKIARIQGQFLDYTWRYAYHLCKKLQEKEADASFRDIVFGINQLVDVMSHIQVAGGHTPVSTPVIEVSEQTSITIRRFLEKKKEMESSEVNTSTEKVDEINLADEPPDHRRKDERPGAVEAKTVILSTENGANG